VTAELRVDEPVPLYYQLELALRRRIESGELAPGSVLPGEHLLAERFGVSRITVRHALDRLEEDGLIVRRRGARTVIAPNPLLQPKVERNPTKLFGFEDDMLRLGLRPRARLLEATTGAPPGWAASLLGLPPGADIVRIRRLGTSDGVPLWVESRFFPPDVGAAVLGTDLTAVSVRRVVERELGLRIERTEAELEAAVATRRQAELLGLAPGAPLLQNRSVAWAEGRGPVEVTLAHWRGDRYKLVLRAGRQDEQPSLELALAGTRPTDPNDPATVPATPPGPGWGQT
jgi:GntR family transcriptional regulator